MREYTIITDSCCDLSPELVEKCGVKVIPMRFTIGTEEYLNYPDEHEMNSKTFYSRLRSGNMASTSAINIDEFTNIFEPIIKSGKDILYLAFSSGLSSTYNVSTIVANELTQKYPDSKILCVDTLSASMGEGLLVYLTAMKSKEGLTIEQVYDFAEQNKLNLCHQFTVDDLFHLKRGGRVSAATAIVGSVLNIKPVLHVDDDGHLINIGKARGRKASLLSLLDKMKQTVINPENQTVFISHGDSLEDAEFLKGEVLKTFKCKEVYINPIGPVIGAHSGPGTMALFYLGTKR